MTFIRQVLILAAAQIRIFIRNYRAAFWGLVLSIAYLIIGNQILVITFGNRISVGVCTHDLRIAKDVEIALKKSEIQTLHFFRQDIGEKALKNGDVSALISVTDTELTFTASGRNPMLDAQISALLLSITPRLSSRTIGFGPGFRIKVNNLEMKTLSIVTFMTASLLPFLIIHLGLIYCGQFWVQDWENGRIYTLLASPAHRNAIIIGRTIGFSLLMIINLAISLTICRFVMTWQIPSSLLLWFLLILIQIFAATGLNFFFASLCKKFVLYANVVIIMLFLMSFISGVIIPAETLPHWEQILARFTPAFYAVRSMRSVMLGRTPVLIADFLALFGWGAGFYVAGYFLMKRSTIDSKTRG